MPYIFFEDSPTNIQISFWVYAVFLYDTSDYINGAMVITEILKKVEQRCEDAARRTPNKSLWISDLLTMLDVVNFLAMSFYTHRRAGFEHQVLGWITTLNKCLSVYLIVTYTSGYPQKGGRTKLRTLAKQRFFGCPEPRDVPHSKSLSSLSTLHQG